MFLSSPSTNWMFTISHWNIWTGLRTINYLVIINIYFLILQVRSFNFLVSDSTKYKHLANQYYKACIRREAGYCKIAWSASSDPDSFKIRKMSKCQTFSSFMRKKWKISTNFIAYFFAKVFYSMKLTLTLCCSQSSRWELQQQHRNSGMYPRLCHDSWKQQLW